MGKVCLLGLEPWGEIKGKTASPSRWARRTKTVKFFPNPCQGPYQQMKHAPRMRPSRSGRDNGMHQASESEPSSASFEIRLHELPLDRLPGRERTFLPTPAREAGEASGKPWGQTRTLALNLTGERWLPRQPWPEQGVFACSCAHKRKNMHREELA